jgi:hypothetical protein
MAHNLIGVERLLEESPLVATVADLKDFVERTTYR